MEIEYKDLLKVLTKLRVDRSKGVAPHKPLLLLVIIELARTGELKEPLLRLTPELAFRFSVYWSIVAHRRSQRPDVRLPFHHMGSSKLWTPLTSEASKSTHRESTVSVAFSDSFFAALQLAEFRYQAACMLISNYFEHAEQVALYAMAGIDPPADDFTGRELEDEADTESRARGRSARFRVDVVAAYCHTCALTGYRVTTVTGHSIVDAAHIHQFADSRNDDPKNGIALCKNAHWLFDLGLWSIDEDFRILIAPELFVEGCPNQEPLLSMVGRELILPRDKQLWPSEKNIAWHRKERFGKLR